MRVFDRANGWAWVQADVDGYAGYVPETAIGDVAAATHQIIAPRTFLYPSAELRKPPVAALSMGSLIRIVGEAETRGTRYLMTEKARASLPPIAGPWMRRLKKTMWRSLCVLSKHPISGAGAPASVSIVPASYSFPWR